MIPAFQAMREGLLDVFGQGALLRGADTANGLPVRINIRFGVQVVDPDSTVVAERIVATMDERLDPRQGDEIVHPDGTFWVDAPLRRNGYLEGWIVRTTA